jgi:SseB protein N-terminal domain
MRFPAAKRAASAAHHDDTVERAFELAAADPARLDDLLGALRRGWLWLPLPDDGAPVTDGSAVQLPTVRYLGDVFIPAYTSPARLLSAAPGPPPGARRPVVPHVAVRAADLARRLPPGLGIALNPGSPRSIPLSPAGVGELTAEQATVGGCRVTVGPPPAAPQDLLAGLAAGLRLIPAAREAATAWLTVRAAPGQGGGAAHGGGAGQGGAGMIISVRLDDPADAAARDAVIAAVEGAVAAAPGGTGWPVDVTFPGEGDPDIIDRWVTTASAPFYRRGALRPAVPAPRGPAG